MLAPRTSQQNRTKVPKPLCGTGPERLRALGSPYRHNPTSRVTAPASDKKQPCVAGPCSYFLRSHPFGSSGFCAAVRGHLTSHVKQILRGG